MDDDIVLNIADGPFQKSRIVGDNKSGRWTERFVNKMSIVKLFNVYTRLKAKRVLKRKNVNKATKQIAAVPEIADLEESPRPKKRVRADIPLARSTAESSATHVAKSTLSRAPQVISSLFTSNPEIIAEDKATRNNFNTKASNAPLTDKSTFSGLGLDPLIVTHLEEKMNITKPTTIQKEALPALLNILPGDASDSGRDVFIQSQTGSGKTLSYLLPIIQDLLPLGTLSYIDRSVGTLAIIIAPTRELAKQISDVLEILLSLRLRPKDDDQSDTLSTRMTRWLVSGLLTGGATRTHEKARLRKGLPILVSTPGRLLDHLQNTSSFNVGKCRWLVLDEADRLMDLGFEESIKGILQALEGRRKLAIQAVDEGKSSEVGGWDWTRRRRTVLCSATIKESVQHLAGTALVKPIIAKAFNSTESTENIDKALEQEKDSSKFTPPSQLLQKYVVTPLKLRLVALVALLRLLLSKSYARQGSKIIVFFSCTDSVDYHWSLFGEASIGDESSQDPRSNTYHGVDSGDEEEEDSTKTASRETIVMKSSLLPQASIYRLHGSLPLKTRLASLSEFAKRPKSKEEEPHSSILFCTSVASRGLDLPLVRAVVQYDLPTEGGVTEYIHRVGRTARVGKGGEAWSIVAPSEKEWVHWIEERMQDNSSAKESGLLQESVESILRNGFGGKEAEYEQRATQVQLAFERWVLKRKEVRRFEILLSSLMC